MTQDVSSIVDETFISMRTLLTQSAKLHTFKSDPYAYVDLDANTSSTPVITKLEAIKTGIELIREMHKELEIYSAQPQSPQPSQSQPSAKQPEKELPEWRREFQVNQRRSLWQKPLPSTRSISEEPKPVTLPAAPSARPPHLSGKQNSPPTNLTPSTVKKYTNYRSASSPSEPTPVTNARNDHPCQPNPSWDYVRKHLHDNYTGDYYSTPKPFAESPEPPKLPVTRLKPFQFACLCKGTGRAPPTHQICQENAADDLFESPNIGSSTTSPEDRYHDDVPSEFISSDPRTMSTNCNARTTTISDPRDPLFGKRAYDR
jgi:hypothetical protein